MVESGADYTMCAILHDGWLYFDGKDGVTCDVSGAAYKMPQGYIMTRLWGKCWLTYSGSSQTGMLIGCESLAPAGAIVTCSNPAMPDVECLASEQPSNGDQITMPELRCEYKIY